MEQHRQLAFFKEVIMLGFLVHQNAGSPKFWCKLEDGDVVYGSLAFAPTGLVFSNIKNDSSTATISTKIRKGYSVIHNSQMISFDMKNILNFVSAPNAVVKNSDADYLRDEILQWGLREGFNRFGIIEPDNIKPIPNPINTSPKKPLVQGGNPLPQWNW
jgi:hypothetical protein